MLWRVLPGRIALIVMLVVLVASGVPAQRLVDKAKGSHFETKKGFMDGNLVGTVYYNFGEIADWQNEPSRSGVWPKGTNHTYIDGVAVIVQAEAHDPQGNTIHPLETNYYEYTRAPSGSTVTYGWWPLPNYAARYQSSPAESSDPNTWPNHWPDRGTDWDGYWNGFFGKGVLNADLETYFVFDDNEDREYILKNRFYPDAADSTRGGLGMQVRGRGFQWSQVLAEDVIFWYYEITNMGTTDYAKTLFAQYVDWGIGGHDNSSNNAGSYDKLLNISYSWSTVSFGSPGQWSPVGYVGYAFLESPGISDDQSDNDQDGLTDERRDNDASVFITDAINDPFLRDVLADTIRFSKFYTESWDRHWDADENCNWQSYRDLNGDGQWNSGEPLRNDVGSDGLGPFDDGYPGPDPDGSEGDGKPEQGEPNFGILDKDESDQLGLTGFILSAVHTYDLNNDERNWTALSSAAPPPDQISPLAGVNLSNHFSSYMFHLFGRNTYSARTGKMQETGETERFSMALIYGLDPGDLFRRKKTVQQIYNANYHFAKPPEKPIVKAIAGDGRVTLYWDERAEKSFDAFYQKYNFEGYKIYRSTEANFLENQLITDAYGKPTFRKPLAQYDVVDGIKGLHPVDVNGALFYLGDDSGLSHSLVDSTVQNGQTYYYAVTAYDQGFYLTNISGTFLGIPPSETSSIIKLDLNGRVTKVDVNTAVVTPRAAAAGYIIPKAIAVTQSGPGTGSLGAKIIDLDSLRDGHNYKVEFADSTAFHDNPNPYYRLVDLTTRDTLLALNRLKGQQQVSPVLRGFNLVMSNDQYVTVNTQKTGWVKGSSNYIVQVGFDSRYATAYQTRRVNYPADFEITIGAKGQGDLSFPSTGFSTPAPSNITIKNLTENRDHIQFVFRDLKEDSTFNEGDALFIVAGDSAGKSASDFGSAKFSWSVSLIKDTTIAESLQRPPQAGDIYGIVTTKPFRTGESFSFTTVAPRFDPSQAKLDLDKIAVVPNPYVGAASWEPATTSVGRGDRRVFFIHLPQHCKIRIYTISGHLVQTLDHDGTFADGQEVWNLTSRDGMDIAFGVYVFHVDAPGIGTKIDRFAILK
jgi:hypothetical protein